MPTLDWIGKQAVVNHHREVPYHLVHCDSDLSAGDPNAGNLLVQGDNLEALRALLPYYAGQVKCIYIDPPYNTGNEGWIYNDNVNSPEIKAWLDKVVGKEGEDLSRHDKWLCMMYPRLRLLREFLREDGVIVASIDDNAVHLLRILLDEIFGASNFVSDVIWNHSVQSKGYAGSFSLTHNHTIFYSKTGQFDVGILPREDHHNVNYSNPDNDPRGPWRSGDVRNALVRPNLMYDIVTPSGKIIPHPKKGWRISEERLAEELEIGKVKFSEDETRIIRKIYLDDQEGRVPETIWFADDVGTTREANRELKNVHGGEFFDTPKPSRLVKRILELTSGQNELILDSFAGSGTTGHAVLDLNKQDGGNRRFILVEMDKRISKDVTAERLRRVIGGYDKGGDNSKPVEGLGGGFRYCQLGKPLFDEYGDIAPEVTFPDLAAHIFFSETGVPIPAKAASEYLGVFQDRAVYLLFHAAHAETPREAVGNVLTPDRLDALPPPPEGFDGLRVVYGEGCTVSVGRMKAAGVVFKQIPYQIDGA